MKRTLKFALIALLCLLFCSLGMVACGPTFDKDKTEDSGKDKTEDNGGGKTENEDNGSGKTNDENYGDVSYEGDWSKGEKLPGREQITKSEVTVEQVKTWFKPYADATRKITGDELLNLIFWRVADEEEGMKKATQIIKSSGITSEQLTSLAKRTQEGIKDITDIIVAIQKSDDFASTTITTAKIESVFNAAKAALEILKPEQMQAIWVNAIDICELGEDDIEGVHIQYNNGNSENKSLEEAKTFFGDRYKYVESLCFTDEQNIRPKTKFKEAFNDDSTTYTVKAVVNGAKALLDVDPKKYENLAKIAYSCLKNGIDKELLSGKGSYKQMVEAINTCGEALNAFVGGLGDIVEFEKNVTKAYKKALVDMGCDPDDDLCLDIFGICGILKTAADILQNLKTEFVADVYIDYDDYAKATTEAEQQEKIGYIVAKVGNYVNKHYKLNEKSEQFVNNVLKGIDGRRSVNFVEVKSLMKKCSAKSAEDTTAQERTAYATQLKKLIEMKKNSLEVDVYKFCFVPVGADNETVKKELDYRCYYNGEGFDASQVTVSCDTSKEGFCDVIFEYKGEKVIKKSVVYAYDKTSASKFVYTTRYGVPAISVSEKEEITNEQIIDAVFSSGYGTNSAYHKETGKTSKYLGRSTLITENAEKIEVIGFDQSKLGEYSGLVKVTGHKILGDFCIPFVYYVYDPNKTPLCTGVNIEGIGYTWGLLQGVDFKDIENKKIWIYYNHCSDFDETIYFKDERVSVEGFDKNKLGKQKIKIIVKVDGKEYSFDQTVKVTTIGRATGYANLETDIGINQEIDKVSVHVDIYLYDADGNYSVENVWETMTIAELRTRMARYGFELKHDIDTSVGGEREGKIWLEKDGQEVCELFSGNVIVLFAERVDGDVDLQQPLYFEFEEDIDAISVWAYIDVYYGYMCLDHIVETMTIAELRTRMAGYGFELKHDIDTSVGGEREGKIWLEKDGQEACELFSGMYRVNVTEDTNATEDTKVSVEVTYTFTGGEGFLGEEDGVYLFAVGSDVNQMTMTVKLDFFVNGERVDLGEQTSDNTTIAEINEQSEEGEGIIHNINTQIASDEVKEGEFWFDEITEEGLKKNLDSAVGAKVILINQKINYKVVETTPAEQ